MKKKRFMILSALVLSLSLLCACGGEDPQTPPVTTEQDTTPVVTQPEDTTNYPLLVTAAFDGLDEAPAEQFDTVAVANGLKLTTYRGSAAKVRIPEQINGVDVVALGDDLFAEHTEITVLYIPDSVTYFGTDVLKGCSSIYALRTPLPQAEQAYLGYLYGAASYETNNQPALRSLDFLELGGSLDTLPAYALYDCNDLVALRLPESVKTLDSYSLYRCESLKYLNTEGITTLKTHALAYCAALESLTLTNALQSVELGALEGCNGLRRLTLPFLGQGEGENDYLAYLFGAADPMFSASFYPTGSGLQSVTVTGSLKTLGDYAFFGCTSLISVSLPSSVTTIGVRAFSGCRRLQELTLPSALTTIRENAFYGCAALTTLTLNEGLTAIGVNAFAECTGLETVSLPSTLKTLPNGCFSSCKSLRSVALGGVESVGVNAFHGCTGLLAVTSGGRVRFEDGNETAKALLNP